MRASSIAALVLSLAVLFLLACSGETSSPAKTAAGPAKPAAPKEDPAVGKTLLDAALAKAGEKKTQVLVEYYDPT